MYESNKLGSKQASATESILPKAQRLLEYACAISYCKLVFRKYKMENIFQSDAPYNLRKGARSIAGLLMYFGDAAKNPLQPNCTPRLKNGAIMSERIIVDITVASAREVKYGAELIAAQHVVVVNARIIAV